MQLAFDRTGSGPPLLLLHPLGADRRIWDPVLDGLARDHDVIAVDLPGFGESPPITDRTPTPAVLAEAVGTWLAGLGVTRPHVAGNSLGGWIALELGRGGVAASVTAIAPAGLWSRPLVPKPALAHTIGAALSPLAPALVALPAGRRLVLAGSMAHPSRMSAGAAVHLVRAWATAPGFNAVNAAMRSGRFLDLAAIDCPVTLVWPARDRLVRRPRDLPDGIDEVELPDAGHIPMSDDPDGVCRALLRGASRAPEASGATGTSGAAG